MCRINGAVELTGGERTIIEIRRRGMSVDKKRAVARIEGPDFVNVLAVADVGVDRPTNNGEFLTKIVLIVVFLECLLRLHFLWVHHQFAWREQGTSLTRGDDLTAGLHARGSRRRS